MPEPRYVGGQAVMEGVMMRGATTWAVSVRTPTGEIRTEVNQAPVWARRWAKVPAGPGRRHPDRVHGARHAGPHLVHQPGG